MTNSEETIAEVLLASVLKSLVVAGTINCFSVPSTSGSISAPIEVISDSNVIAIHRRRSDGADSDLTPTSKSDEQRDSILSLAKATSGSYFTTKPKFGSNDFGRIFPTSEMMGAIRASFSLNMTELSAVLRIERPTAYAWLGGSTIPSPRNADRVRKVFLLAQEWMSLGLASMTRAHLHAGQPSLLELLKNDELNISELVQQLRQISRSIGKSPPRKPGIKEIAQDLGIKAAEPEFARDQIDFLTGRRIGPEE